MNAQQRRRSIREEAREKNLYPHQIKAVRAFRRMANICRTMRIKTPVYGAEFRSSIQSVNRLARARPDRLDGIVIIPANYDFDRPLVMKMLKSRSASDAHPSLKLNLDNFEFGPFGGISIVDEANMPINPSVNFAEVLSDVDMSKVEILKTAERPDGLTEEKNDDE